MHADIRTQAGGRFSHWDGILIFSASDGSDPRTNGRTYTITTPTELKTRLLFMLLSFLVLADAAFVILFRNDLIAFGRRRHPQILAGIAAALVLLAGLSAFGLPGAIVVAKDGPPKDAALVLQILQHALLGCVTSCGAWAAGAGVTRLLLRDPRRSLAQVLIPAFPVSLVLLTLLVAVALLMPWGLPLAFALWLACLAPLSNWRPRYTQITTLLKASISIIPLSIAFGVWLALLWHGPTDTLSGSPSGDLSFYAGNIWSLAAQPYPSFDLGYSGGGATSYFNRLYPALGAVLLYLPHFDPFLFLLASGGTSYVLLTALMVHLYAADSGERLIASSDLVLVTLAFVIAARYPYWVAESIPMVFVPALTASVWWMAKRGPHAFGWGIAAMLAGLSGSLLSKITSAAVLVPLGFTGIWWQIRALPFAAKLAVFATIAIFGAYSSFMLAQFLPSFLATAAIGPESFRTPHWYFVSRDAAAVLMMVLAWLIADWPVALSLTFGLLTFLAFSWIFQVNFVCVSIVVGLILISLRSTSILPRLLGLIAFALSLPALIFGDQAGLSSGLIWIACIGGAVLAALLSASEVAIAGPKVTLRTSAFAAATAIATTVLGLIGVARGSIIADSGWYLTQAEPLTPALKEIWSAVRERTPRDVLIFTDQVDETEHVLGGWNTFAYSGQRQIYLSSHYTNLELRRDHRKLEQVLATNKAVLDGSLAPQRVPVPRTYGSFYAVVTRTRAIPPDWQLVFENQKYALYRITVR
ncbi:hypothetical protein [Bradyrhizobium liaoningense]|uniref:hypothetical protein n=1 Tax=Bradyrhizobium liaoningense TaxID=43992 RepID=UPI001BA745DD|nr:hypothetical protein [Bradyrhizobium liaoningense]MBR0713079.1 hypothetical protein [Bradyrhizobium liaoningense]